MKIVNKKSIYLNNKLHLELKALAMIEHCSMIQLIENLLRSAIRKKLDDLKTKDLAHLASISKSFEFLKNSKENRYTDSDGEEI